MEDWEDIFTTWGKPPSETEQEKCDNTISMIKDAISKDEELSKRKIRVFVQGSYKNNTNVRLESDVDICVCFTDVCFTDLPDGTKNTDFGLKDSDYKYADSKNSVETALVNKFEKESIDRGNKAFRVHSNTYHIDADVVACFDHLRYKPNKSCIYGTELRTDKENDRVINWPDQHYKNGVEKNNETGKRFKTIVRILKKLSLQMAEDKIDIAEKTPSFLIECLVWNVPNENLKEEKLFDAVMSSLSFLNKNLSDFELCKGWGEVSELKYLFRDSQPWKLEDTHLFIAEAIKYING